MSDDGYGGDDAGYEYVHRLPFGPSFERGFGAYHGDTAHAWE
jgi:hypothetical protein